MTVSLDVSETLARLIPQIEERLNHHALITKKFSDISADLQERINDALEHQPMDISAADYALKLLPERGFAHKNGNPYHAHFYEHADISADVWDYFRKSPDKSSEDTLLKIVIGLRMNEMEAREFLALAGKGFAANNPIHQLILALIDIGCYKPMLVCEVLDFYIKDDPKKYRGYHNIYRA